jgi:threonylcarbamoyladenosine tRNA methylthiotransferase MtaB
MKVYVRGLNACVQRKSDIARYKRFLVANGHGLAATPLESDAILLWTCAFRRDFRDNSLKKIKEFRELGPELIVCGCLPSIDPEGLSANYSGKSFPWREEKTWFPRFFGANGGGDLESHRVFSERNITQDLMTCRKANPDHKVFFCDQFVKLFVSEGCRCECSYCAERLAFPAYRSFPQDLLVAECRHIVASTGAQKVMLWADSLGDYGVDCNSSLPMLVENLLAVDDDLVLGLSSLNPQHFLEHFEAMLALVEAGRIFSLELPIQSASDRILRQMQRKYEKGDIERLYASLAALNFTEIETDIILGFPGETEADFEETLDFLLAHRPKYVMISRYLETNGMLSREIGGKVPMEIIWERLARTSAALTAGHIAHSYDNNLSTQETFDKEQLDLSESSSR